MATIAVIDYGMSNLRSVSKALEHVAPRARVVVTDDAQAVRRADRVVFPGQGAIGDCMRQLDSRGLREVVAEVARERPFLGVCLGLQALMAESEEDDGTPGLGLILGTVRYLGSDLRDPQTGARLKIPHMGWNQVQPMIDHPLWRGIPERNWFYFVHSYYVEPAWPDPVAGVTDYGFAFTSVIAEGSMFAVQFHPEKSQQHGLRLLENFVGWQP